MKLKLYIPILFGLIFCFGAKAQNVAVKTNLLYDAAATINAGVEVGLAPNGHSMCRVTLMVGPCRTTVNGSIG